MSWAHAAVVTVETSILAVAAVLAVAFLYASVGHAGASGYIAALSLAGFAPAEIKPLALTLNILVASVGTWQFRRAGHFSSGLFWPLAAASAPCALAGGYLQLPPALLGRVLGAILFLAAAQLVLRPPADAGLRPVRVSAAVALGAGIGAVAGLTGTGGGIFLTPALLFLGWAPVKRAAAVSAPFILVNSAAGLLGHVGATGALPGNAALLLAAAAVGGTAGSYFGSRTFSSAVVKRLLAIVLVIAGCRLLWFQPNGQKLLPESQVTPTTSATAEQANMKPR